MQALVESLAAVNATLNALAGSSMLAGIYFIRRGERVRHERAMIAAACFSALFLVCYLVRVYFQGTHPFPGTGLVRIVYLVILFSHLTLAMAVVPLVLATIYTGLRRRWPGHRRLGRVTYPIWLYVSVTGVIVYFMLYQIHWV